MANKPVLMTAEQLQDFMNERGLDVHELAELLRVTEGAVRHWLTKRRDIPGPVWLICQYCDDFNINLREFCEV